MKNRKRFMELTILISVVVAIIIGLFIVINRQSILSTLCEEEFEQRLKEEQNVKYEEGTVLVRFKESVDEKDALKLIESYDLVAKYYEWHLGISNIISVNVPVGYEIKWLCVLKENSLVKDSYLNNILFIGD